MGLRCADARRDNLAGAVALLDRMGGEAVLPLGSDSGGEFGERCGDANRFGYSSADVLIALSMMRISGCVVRVAGSAVVPAWMTVDHGASIEACHRRCRISCGMAYRDYTADGTYWTVRKRGKVYWVVRIDPSNGDYRWSEVWGGYTVAGAAGGAAAQLAYAQGQQDVAQQLRGSLHEALDKVGLGALPNPAPVAADKLPSVRSESDEDEE
ncbi:hypothetical protein ACFPIJ_12115 [Dactylosporangium cerinum]|uniref:Uncharacterized protein n=1 Tax=Dactylosporangium cerinum TaxID=1434730 RepID=A0ABV9VTG4_9ACTN